MKRITKAKARRMFMQGRTINLLPCRVNLNNEWIYPCSITKTISADFDSAVNSFEYYNCGRETGYHAAYYV